MNEIINDYRKLHKIAEVGFELKRTVEYVKSRLTEMGVKYTEIGNNSITATLGRGEKCILLRADMDALPIKEETSLEYSCENGNMHACGHDAHTAMLLGAAKMLKENDSDLKCTVKLLFQAAEETLEGAKNAIENGILDTPRVDAAVMLHVVVGTEFENGSIIVSSIGVSAPAVEYFRIKIKGKGAHGSTPEKSKDALALACRIALAFEEIKAKELGLNEKAVITVGSLIGGNSANVIPDTAVLQGSARAFREDTMKYIKKRIMDISKGYATTYGLEAETEFYSSAPALENNGEMSEFAVKCGEATLGKDKTFTSEIISKRAEKNGEKSVGAGSEDFAYIAREVPSVMIALCAGKASQGYTYPLHHPKFRLDESSLEYGSKLFYAIATNYN